MVSNTTSQSDGDKRMAITLDPNVEFEALAINRIESEEVGWLTTVNGDLVPQPNPVWFIWDDGSFVIISKPKQAKLINIGRNPHVSLNLETSEKGGIVVFTGKAKLVDRDSVSPVVLDRMAAKYESGLQSINYTREFFEREYSATIRFTPEKVRGW